MEATGKPSVAGEEQNAEIPLGPDSSQSWVARPLAGSLLCTIMFWDSWNSRLFAISSRFKTQVLADDPWWYLGTERPDTHCPGDNSHHHSPSFCFFILLQNAFFFSPALVLDEVHQLHTYIHVRCLFGSFFWRTLGFKTSENNVLPIGNSCFLHMFCMADNVNPEHGENSWNIDHKNIWILMIKI